MASIAEQHHKPWSMARVITASSAGTAFEWYDFFIFGSLAQIISKVFFAGLDPTAALIAALGLFAAGFAFRPLGAMMFGVVGDRIGRKGAFLVTVSLMGARDVRHRPAADLRHAGASAPALLIFLRILPGHRAGRRIWRRRDLRRRARPRRPPRRDDRLDSVVGRRSACSPRCW